MKAIQSPNLLCLTTSPAITPALVATCARQALDALRAACGAGAGGSRRLALCAALIEREALPQAGRWHRRDLAAGATAAWRAVLRALAAAGPPRSCVQLDSEPASGGDAAVACGQSLWARSRTASLP
jgi:hypothetical protein